MVATTSPVLFVKRSSIIPTDKYGTIGKDDLTFKVHDGTVFSKDAKVSIKIEKNEKLSNDQVQKDRQRPNK